MKTTFIPKIGRKVLLPLIAATTLTTTAAATTKEFENQKKYEIVNKDIFEKADKNQDEVLDYNEFLNIKNLEKPEPNTTINKKQKTTNKERFWGLGFLAFSLAIIGIIQDIRHPENNDNKRNPLF